MSVSQFANTISQTFQFSKANSGFAATTVNPTGVTAGITSASGVGYLKQTPISSGSTFSIDFASGGNTDLVGVVANFAKSYAWQFQAGSGAVQLETTQSGGLAIPQLGLSGGGVLLNPGGYFALGETYSGVSQNLSDVHGNLVFRAVSGACLLSVSAYGL